MCAMCDCYRATLTYEHRKISPYPSRYCPPLSTRNMELLACTRAHDFSSGASGCDNHAGHEHAGDEHTGDEHTGHEHAGDEHG